MKKYTKLMYKSNNRIYYGRILGFKEDKVHVEKCLYSDFSGHFVNTWIDKTDIINVL